MNFTLHIYKKWLTFMNCGCYILRFKNCCGNSIRNKSSHISIMRFLLYFYYRFCFCALLKKQKVVKIENHLSAFSNYFKFQIRLVVQWTFSFIYLYNKTDVSWTNSWWPMVLVCKSDKIPLSFITFNPTF